MYIYITSSSCVLNRSIVYSPVYYIYIIIHYIIIYNYMCVIEVYKICM